MTSTDSVDSQSSGSYEDGRDSGMSIELAISLRYQRKRPDTKGDRLESRLDSVGLLLIGSVATILLLVWLVPKILAAIP